MRCLMARKCHLARELKRERLTLKYYKRRLALRKAQSNKSLSFIQKEKTMLSLSKLPRDSSPSRRTTRCFVSGTSHSVYKKFMLGRIAFRQMASAGLLPGVTKSSW